MTTPKENGCLGIFFKGLLIIFLIGNGYAVVRVEWARIQVYRLARQLDYTPERYLHSALVYHTTNLVTGAAESYVALYDTTPLTPATYRERLAQIDPEVSDDSGILSTTNYLIRELGIAVFPQENNNRDQPDDHSAGQFPFPAGWILPSYEVRIDFQVFSPQGYRVEYEGQPIVDNVVKIKASGGIIQPWFSVGVLLWEKVHFFGI